MRVNLPSFEQLTSGIYADIGEMPDNEPILIRYLSEQPSPEVWSVSQAMPARHCRGPEPGMTKT